MSVQWKGRPLIYNGDQAVRAPFLAEQMVGEVSMHYLYVAGEAGRVWCWLPSIVQLVPSLDLLNS